MNPPLPAVASSSPSPGRAGTVCFLGLVLAFATSPCRAEDPELEQLRASYGAAVERTARPVVEGYARELRRVLEARTRASDLDGALAMTRELERVAGGDRPGDAVEEKTETEDDAELARLRATYERARDRAVAPLLETYRRELERMIQTRTRNSDLEGALLAREELARHSGVPAGGGGEASGSSRRPPDEFFVGRTWVSDAGTAFHFAEGGICVREARGNRTEGTWRRRGALVISYVDGSPQSTRYFRFVSPEEAYYGNSANETDTPVALRETP